MRPKYVVRFTTITTEERKLYYIVNLSKLDKLGCPDQVLTTPYRKHAFVFCRLLNKQST